MERERADKRRSRRIVRTARRWQRTAGEVARREGTGRLLARTSVVVRGAVYRYVVFVGIDLTSPAPELAPGPPIEMRLLGPEDVEAYARFRGRPVESVPALRRLERGHLCVAAWLDGEIVSAIWYALRSAWMDEIDRGLTLTPNELYAYDSYTTESRRGQGIAPLRGRWALEYFREHGYRRTVAWISPQNLPALRAARKIGTELGRAGFVRLGPLRRDFVQPSGGTRRWAARNEPIVVERDFGVARDG